MLHLKMIFRSWLRSPLSTIISLISLALGLLCSTVLILFVLGEYKTANALGDTSNVYLLESVDYFYTDKNVRSSRTSPVLALDMSEKFGEVQRFTTAMDESWKHKDAVRAKNYWSKIYSVTPQFAEMFDIPVLEGDLKKTLSSASEVAVTNSYIQYVYGKDAVIGDRIMAESGGNMWVNGVQQKAKIHDVIITTILDENTKTPLAYGGLHAMAISEINEKRSVYSNSFYSFIQLRADSDIETLQNKVKADTVNFKKDMQVFYTPFQDVYFDDTSHNTMHDGGFIVRRDSSILSIGMTIAFAVLFIAAFNYVNITMTRARGRLKNIAGQRIFGATKWSVRLQTVLDTTLLVLVSFGVALLVMNAILPQFNSFMDSDITIADIFAGVNALYITGLLAVLILLPSLYILLKIEVSSPMETFKNPMGKSVKISSIMVIAQFVISVVLIVVSLNISRQMNYIASDRPNAKNVVLIYNSANEKLDAEFVTQIQSQAFVESYDFNGPVPRSSVSSDGKNANYLRGGNQVIEFYEMRMLEGRNFVESDTKRNVILNEAAARQFEIESPVEGKSFTFNGDTVSVIGMVKDFLYDNAHKAIQPLVIEPDKSENDPANCWGIYVKVAGNTDVVIDQIKAMYKGKGPLGFETVAQMYKDMHPAEKRLQTMVDIFMYISMLLTALGLFGLAFYTVGRRRKEIAIRKIHGSTTLRVILLLCRTFAMWVGIAFVIAVPIAYYLSSEWLSTFIYRAPMVAWVFLATAGVAALVTFVTVIFQTWRAASENPAESIKN